MKPIFLIFLTTFLLIFSACSEAETPDCSSSNTDYVTYSYNQDSAKCEVANKIEKDVCGNGIKEKGETYCNCADDVDKTDSEDGCFGNKGDYLENTCVSNSCELLVTNKVKETTKLLTVKSSSDFSIDTEVLYSTPFMVDRHTINLNLFLKNILATETQSIKEIFIQKIHIITKANELLGTQQVNKKLSVNDRNADFSIDLDSFTFDTFQVDKRSVQVKFLITYVKDTLKDGKVIKSENKVVEPIIQFESKLQIINPENKNGEDTSSGGWS